MKEKAEPIIDEGKNGEREIYRLEKPAGFGQVPRVRILKKNKGRNAGWGN